MSSASPGAPVHVVALGVRLAVTFDDAPPGTRDAFAHAWSRARCEPGQEPAEVPTVVPAPAATDASTALHQLAGTVTVAAIEAAAGALWMLHAAGLAHPVTGAGLALVAPSGTGKSTAARSLGRALGYLSDETVGITSDGALLPHAKPLSIVRADSPVKDQVSPDDAGLLPAPADARLRAVIVLARDGSPTPWLEPVRTAAALPLLAEQTSYLTRLPRPLSFLAGVLAGTDGVQVLHYRDIGDAGSLVQELLG